MSASDLKLKIDPKLQAELGISGQGDAVDYFALFGLPREAPAKGVVEAAVLDRSKKLRPWQTSAQFGDEVVALLKSLHRAAKILQDDKRRSAYLEELDRAESGKKTKTEDEYRDLVRAALVDGEISPEARNALNEYIQVRKLDGRLAQQITQQVREELKAKRAEAAAAAPAADDNWEFSIKGAGEEGYAMMLSGLAQSGRLRDTTVAHLMGDAQKYGITTARATQLIAEYKKHEFEAMVRLVAGNRVLSNSQAKLLADKAPAYGLDAQAATQIIAEYTLSVNDPAAMMGKLTLADTFDQDEIAKIIEGDTARKIKRSGFRMPDFGLSASQRSLIKLVVILAVILGVGWWAKTAFFPSSEADAPSDSSAKSPASSSPLSNLTPLPGSTSTNPGGSNSTPAAPAATPPPQNTPADIALVSLPDPPSGFLALAPERPTDPPAFELAISELTNAQYQQYIQTTLEPPPKGWPNGQPPDGTGDLPVTEVTYTEADRYVHWLSNSPGGGNYQYMLPSAAQYLRALRGRALRGLPTDPDYFGRAQLGGKSGLSPVRQTVWDKIYIAGKGQIYDLVGNAAEWGSDVQGTQHAILGGDFSQKADDFNHLQTRWAAPDTSLPSLGFRLARHPK